MLVYQRVMWKPPAAELAEFSYHQLCRQLCRQLCLCRNAATLGKQTEKVSVLCHREFCVFQHPSRFHNCDAVGFFWAQAAQGSFQIIRFIMYPVSIYHLTIHF